MKRFMHRIQPIAQIRKRARRRKEMKAREKQFMAMVNEIKKGMVENNASED